MTDTPENPEKPEKPADTDRIAKVIARAGLASRREAERMIVEGRVTVNGQKIDSPALDVTPNDRIVVDGKKLDEKQETRLWLYYKPIGLVTSESDEKGRQTVFDALPRDLPRVMTVGRLDLNSEGLLLLTNDGELKRRLELPATGWLRRYRVRVNGTPSDLTFAPLRRGATIDGEDFAPMEIKLDSQQGANAWLTVGIREGRNREIRRAMAHVGLQVNRLIRIGYGPFKLAGLEKNEVSEIKRKVLRDQLGGLLTGEASEKEREMRPRGAEGARKPFDRSGDRSDGPRRSFRDAGEGGERPQRRFGDDRPRREDGEAPRSFRSGPKTGPREGQGDRPRWNKDDRPARSGNKPWEKSGRPRAEGDQSDRPRRSFGDKPGGNRPARAGKPWEKSDGPRGSRAEGEQSDRPRRSFGEKPGGNRPARAGKPWEKSDGPRGPRAEGDQSDRPRRSFGEKPGGNRPARAGKPWEKSDGPRGPRTEGEQSDRPRRNFGDKSTGGQSPRKSFGKPGGKPGFKGADRGGAGRPSGRPGGKPGGRPAGGSGGPKR